MDLENVVAVSGAPGRGADAEPENAADSPVEEDGGYLFDKEEAKDRPQSEGTGAPENGGDAGLAGRQPKDERQSKTDDSKYAAARRDADAHRKEAEEARRTAEDRLKAEREGMEAFARQRGYQTFAQMQRAEQIKKYTSSGVPDEYARELADMKAKLEGSGEESGEERRFDELLKAYPETRHMDELPDEVARRIAGGETPVNAYRDFKMEQLANENQALKQNQANRKKALGSVKGRGADNADLFLFGLKG